MIPLTAGGYLIKINKQPIMKKHPYFVAALAVIVIYFSAPGAAEGQSLAKARQFSQSGLYQEAADMYAQLLSQNPGNPEIVLAQAHNYSWWGQYPEAIKAFSEILAADPGNPDAFKGIAFTYFYQNDLDGALTAFEAAIAKNPDDYDLALGKGLVLLAGKEYSKARRAFERALEIKPGSEEAKRYLQTANLAPGFLEGDVWVGYSQLAGQENKFKLRGLQLGVQAAKNWRAVMKYDNSLALDILNLARQDKNMPMVSAGLIHEWNKKLFSELEYGLRFLDKNQTQQFLSAGQVFFLQQNMRIKLGGFAGFGQNIPKEWMAYASFNLPATAHIRIEPTYYLIQPPNGKGFEHRLQLGLQYQTNRGYQLNLYGTYGNTLVDESAGRQQLFGWSLTALAPFSRSVWGQLALRQEKGVFYNFTSLALGIQVRVQK